MKRSTAKKGATLGAAALTSIVIPTMPSQAQSDQTQVRFLHAVAGAGPASLLVEKGGPRLPSAFAKPSGYQVFRPGQTRLRLILNGQSSPVATEMVRLGPGRHTVVAVGTDKGVDLLVYQDDGVEPGKATLRAVHVASEVGKADVRVDGKVVASRRRARRRHRLSPRAPRPPLRGRHATRRPGRCRSSRRRCAPSPAPRPAASWSAARACPPRSCSPPTAPPDPPRLRPPASAAPPRAAPGCSSSAPRSSAARSAAPRTCLPGAPARAAPCRWPRPL